MFEVGKTTKCPVIMWTMQYERNFYWVVIPMQWQILLYVCSYKLYATIQYYLFTQFSASTWKQEIYIN